MTVGTASTRLAPQIRAHTIQMVDHTLVSQVGGPLSIGFALPAAMGAAFVRLEKPVVVALETRQSQN